MGKLGSGHYTIELCNLSGGYTPIFEENFDSYANDMVLNGVNGWAPWANNSTFISFISNLQARSCTTFR